MPAFGELLGQEAAWAIRTYIETRPDDGALDDFQDQLKGIRDDLIAKSNAVAAGETTMDAVAGDVATARDAMLEIAKGVETGSGAPRADSVASRAAAALDQSAGSLKRAAEIMTVGLSAAE